MIPEKVSKLFIQLFICLNLILDLDLVSKFKGASGSIEDICLHPSLPFLGVVGLDRYLRYFYLPLIYKIKY